MRLFPLGPVVYARTTESPILLIGAAHVVDLAEPLRRVLADRPLDGVAVELDPERADALFAPEGERRPAAGAPLFARLWSLFQRRLGAEIGGGLPGAEMKAAATFARERGLPVFLIDDPIRVTLVRLVRSLPIRERVTILVSAFVALFVPSRVVEREMDRYVEAPEDYAAQLREASPTLARILLDDRNEHMADRLKGIRDSGYGRVAAVVGDAHLSGLRSALGRRGIPCEAIPFRDLRATIGRGPSSS